MADLCHFTIMLLCYRNAQHRYHLGLPTTAKRHGVYPKFRGPLVQTCPSRLTPSTFNPDAQEKAFKLGILDPSYWA